MKRYIKWALRKEHYMRWAFWLPLIFVMGLALIAWLVFSFDGNSNEWSNMVTIASYGDGEKIQVRESILWAVGFLLFLLVTNIGSNKDKN